MKPLYLADSQRVADEIKEELRRSEESRYFHRLHALFLVARGMTCPEVAELLGDAPRSVENWVRQFEADGLAGLHDERRGRPGQLRAEQMAELESALRSIPKSLHDDRNFLDGKTLASWIEIQYGVRTSVRQCQRLLVQMGFRSLASESSFEPSAKQPHSTSQRPRKRKSGIKAPTSIS